MSPKASRRTMMRQVGTFSSTDPPAQAFGQFDLPQLLTRREPLQ